MASNHFKRAIVPVCKRLDSVIVTIKSLPTADAVESNVQKSSVSELYDILSELLAAGFGDDIHQIRCIVKSEGLSLPEEYLQDIDITL